MGEVPPALEWAPIHRAGYSVHVPDVAAVELIDQIQSGRFTWQQWLRARAQFKHIIDRDLPVLPGGIQMLHVVGAIDAPTARTAERMLNDATALWRILLRAESIDDLSKTYGARRNQMSAATARELLDRSHAHWTRGFSSLQQHNVTTEGAMALNTTGDLIRIMQDDFDSRAPNAHPRLSTRLDAFIRTYMRYSSGALKTRHAYAFDKHSNDAIDHELLRCFAIPTLLCSGDGRLHTAVRESGSWQAKWLFRVDELLAAANAGALPLLEWPTDMTIREATRA